MIVTELRVGLNRRVQRNKKRTAIEHKNITVWLRGVRWFSKACLGKLHRHIRLHKAAGWSLSGFAFVKEHRHVSGAQ